VRHDEQTHQTPDGATVFRRQWLPDGDATAVVCLVHGLGEHSGRYGYVAERLTSAGFAVCAMDLRGHGRSSGTRGDLRVDQALADIEELIADARLRVPDVPVVLYGHSLGALLTMTYTVRRRPDIAAQVASAPALDTTLREQRVKFFVANTLGGLAPGVVIPSGLDANAVSRDPEVVKAYVDDPLVHDKGSFGLAKQTFAAMDALALVREFPVPLLIIHGTDDSLTVPAASKEFTDRVAGDVTLIEYRGLYHEPHNEPEKEQVLDDVLEWLRPRVAAG
jgi:alpha-beta hydrolase superfamily lysophospholipase